jgi:hypothetical protein
MCWQQASRTTLLSHAATALSAHPLIVEIFPLFDSIVALGHGSYLNVSPVSAQSASKSTSTELCSTRVFQVRPKPPLPYYLRYLVMGANHLKPSFSRLPPTSPSTAIPFISPSLATSLILPTLFDMRTRHLPHRRIDMLPPSTTPTSLKSSTLRCC